MGTPVGDLIVAEKAKSADVSSTTAGAGLRANDGGRGADATGEGPETDGDRRATPFGPVGTVEPSPSGYECGVYTPVGDSEPVGSKVSVSAGDEAVANDGEGSLAKGDGARGEMVSVGTEGVARGVPKYDLADDHRPQPPEAGAAAARGACAAAGVPLDGRPRPRPAPSEAFRYMPRLPAVGKGGGRATVAGALPFLCVNEAGV